MRTQRLPHRHRLLALAAAVSLGLAACGPDDPDTTTETTEDLVQPTDDGADSDYTPLTPRADLISLAPGAIDEIVADPTNDSQLLLHFEGAAEPCSGAAVTVTESSTSVIIEFQVGLDPNAAAMSCIAQVFDYEIVIPLEAPLGDRTINIAG